MRSTRLRTTAELAPHVAEIEEEENFHEIAQSRWLGFEVSGELVAAVEMKQYVRSLAAGKNPAPPRARRVLP